MNFFTIKSCEALNGIQEVSGSIPLISTRYFEKAWFLRRSSLFVSLKNEYRDDAGSFHRRSSVLPPTVKGRFHVLWSWKRPFLLSDIVWYCKLNSTVSFYYHLSNPQRNQGKQLLFLDKSFILSMATISHSDSMSQFAIALISLVAVPNSRSSCLPPLFRQATISFLCTSIPQQHR